MHEYTAFESLTRLAASALVLASAPREAKCLQPPYHEDEESCATQQTSTGGFWQVICLFLRQSNCLVRTMPGGASHPKGSSCAKGLCKSSDTVPATTQGDLQDDLPAAPGPCHLLAYRITMSHNARHAVHFRPHDCLPLSVALKSTPGQPALGKLSAHRPLYTAAEHCSCHCHAQASVLLQWGRDDPLHAYLRLLPNALPKCMVYVVEAKRAMLGETEQGQASCASGWPGCHLTPRGGSEAFR